MIGRSFIAAVALTFGLLLAVAPARAAEDLTARQKQQVEELLRELLIKNPEILVEALEEYQRRQKADGRARARQALVDNREQIFNDPASPVGGNPNGDVTLVEFFDYQCGYCKAVVERVAGTVAKDKNIRWVFKEFPILGPVSVYASRAALAAHRQDKYQELHLAMMRSRGKLTEKKVLRFAAEAGLDVARLEADMKTPEIATLIARNMDLAEALNIRGTPAFVIGDVVVPGAIDAATLNRLIAAARGS
jgi:protein-disulfide isomerase